MSRSFLLFQLFGPLVSWGDIAVGEVRPSFDRPSKSAIVGMIAAALGYRRPHRNMKEAERRELEAKHHALAENLEFALRLDASGVYLQDYHTVQVPPSTEPWVIIRRDELVQYDYLITSKNNTSAATAIESYRDYYANQYAMVCLWKHSEGGPSLEQIEEKLKYPDFTLYLGRKSCPPALPLCPVIVEATNAAEALQKAPHQQKLKALDFPSPNHLRYFWEGSEAGGFGEPDMQVERWDMPHSRSRWQFRPRREFTKTVKPHVSQQTHP